MSKNEDRKKSSEKLQTESGEDTSMMTYLLSYKRNTEKGILNESVMVYETLNIKFD
jgi:hypothetical protein